MSSERKRIVIVGGTSSIAEHCARLWVEAGPVDLVLVGRDQDRTERVAADLRVRGPRSVVTVMVLADFTDPVAIRQAVGRCLGAGPVDIALIAHGSLPDRQVCQEDLSACHEALVVNGVSPALFAEALAGPMQAAGHGTLAIIGSVAGDRGRKSNYAYGAAKGMVDRYAQGLRHRLAGSNVKVVLIKPGPTDTPMTAHLKQQGWSLAKVEDVARATVRAISRGKSVVYVPGKWLPIMMIIRHLPGFVFNKLNI